MTPSVSNRGAATLALFALVVGTLAVGCPSKDESAGAEGASGDRASSGKATGKRASGVVEGFVSLTPGAEVPVLQPPEKQFPAGCPPYEGAKDGRPIRMVGDRRLVGVLVNVTDYEVEISQEPQVRRMAIEDCRLTPSLVSASRGDTLEITNASSQAFWPSVEGDAFTQALLPEQTRSVTLARGGFRKVRCGFDEPCGVAWVVTLYHPLHTVTDGEGAFRIEGVPTGEKVSLSAYHPLLRRPAVTELTLSPGETRRVELVMNPARAPDATE